MFGLNSDSSNRYTQAFADDLIVYKTGTNPRWLKDELNELLNSLNKIFQMWSLRINPDKCETILFRRPLTNENSKKRAEINDFQI
ncbi:GSCOCG00011960001-RA-CDS, partial [Cotesia congregata]